MRRDIKLGYPTLKKNPQNQYLRDPFIETPFFRYLESPHHSSLLRDGSILVGTLYKYKDTLDQQRVDSDEGIGIIRQSYNHFKDDVPQDFRDTFGIGPGPMIGATFINNKSIYISPNCLIMSLSAKKNDPKLLEKFGTNCVEITDIFGFASEITQSLIDQASSNVRDPIIYPIIYDTRTQYYSASKQTHPAWVKTPDYQEEAEVRLLWEIVGQPTLSEHYIIENQNISNYVKLVSGSD